MNELGKARSCRVCVEVELDGADLWKRPLPTARAAEILGVHRSTLHAWIVQGRIPARRFGRNWKVPRSVVERILAGELALL